jgi:hypothetical protein
MIVAAGMLAASRAQTEQRPPPAFPAHAILYEEDTTDPTGKSYVGSVVWSVATVAPRSGAGVEPAIRAEVEVRERGLTMTFALRRNPDPTPATHRIDVSFDLSATFASGGIQNVPGILMKGGEQTRGAPLAGLARKVGAISFQVDLSEEGKQRNLRTLKEQNWFDVPIVFANGRRAILAFEKGASGAEVFDAVLTAWGQ